MKIWVDLANSPHVLFFAPLISEVERRGHEIYITARDFAQTIPLCRLHNLRVVEVGHHGGRSAIGKAWAVGVRSLTLRMLGRRKTIDLAVSHNSYAHCIAAKSLGIPYVTIMDYEHTPANHLSFRLADRILLPSVVTLNSVRKYGANEKKVVRYDGFKEQVYLETFLPKRGALEEVLGSEIWDRYVVVVARPPADFAIYHRFRNPLFETWLESAGRDPTVRVVVLPRTDEQSDRVRLLGLPSVVLPASPIPGADLVARADLVVSAGGTMNREAAVLGVPAYSLFAGRGGEVDRCLEQMGRLTFVRSEAELVRICLKKKDHSEPLGNPGLRSAMVDYILGTVPSPTI